MPPYKISPIKQTATADLSSVALSDTYVMTRDGELRWVGLAASVNITETVTVTLVSVTGATYDIVLDTSNLSAAKNYIFNPAKAITLNKGDAVKITCTKANTTGVVYSTIEVEEIESWKS